jgi:hypothetical protein
LEHDAVQLAHDTGRGGRVGEDDKGDADGAAVPATREPDRAFLMEGHLGLNRSTQRFPRRPRQASDRQL